jgi:putative PEP-CTERM system histidine kinase
LLTARGRGRGPGRWLVLATVLQIAWSVAMANALPTLAMPGWYVAVLEAARPLAWSIFLLAMLRERANTRVVLAAVGLAALLAAAHAATFIVDASAQQRFGSGLLAAVFGLMCVEQEYRNSSENRRWAIRYLCLAVTALGVFDLALYADALLFGQFDYGWWAARGYAHALMVPLVAVTAARTPDWRLDIQVSRKIVFHSATLLASGLFLLSVAAIGYGLRIFGGAWVGVAEVLIAFLALVAAAALMMSAAIRARLRVFVAKNFFTYRYDYRNEWLKLTELLARPDRADDPADALASRALGGISGLVESPGGALWLQAEDGPFVCEARLGVGEREALPPHHPLIRFVAAREWIVDVSEWRAHPNRYDGLALPQWLVSDPDAWSIVPLTLQGRTVGIVQLQRPRVPIALDWEVRDILKTAGRQVAGYLAVRQAVEKLVQARQFDSFNRMSAFVVHDLKNLVAQLSLLLKNAARHSDNREFQKDMLETIENVLDRMQGLLMQLRVGTRPIEQPEPVPLAAAVRATLAAKNGMRPEPMLDLSADLDDTFVVAHRDRLERVMGHLLQNAVEATPAGGSVRVIARLDGPEAVVEVVDTGCGMSRAFVETRLFRPFNSTKEHGMGIGAFESREYVREVGGTLEVSSVEGHGTTFTMRLPVHGEARRAGQDR